MGKAVTFVCVIALGTLLLAEAGEVISSLDADENASFASNVAVTSSSRQENFEQKKTRAQKGDILDKASNETVAESESEGVTVEEIPVKKTPKPTNNNRSARRNNGTTGNVSAGGKGSGQLKKLKNGQGERTEGRNKTEENSPTNASSVLVVARNIGDLNDSDPIEPNESVCTAPPEIEGAITPRLVGAEHAVGTAIAYSCNFGYVSRNSISHISYCRHSEETGKAQWTTPEIQCIPRSCGDPGYLNNGRRIGNLFTFPNKVEYECEEGYKLRGLRARYCQAGGDWSGRLPTCEPIYCKVPSDPVNGRVKYSSLEYGEELSYECDVGYMLKKHEPRICSEDGSWSNEEPECIEARCEPPQSPEYGSVKLLGELKVGTLATYSCDAGRRLVGATTTKCLITGQWTFDAPQCLSTCTVPFIHSGDLGRNHIRNTRRNSREEFVKVYEGEEIESNEALFLRCKVGFLPAEDSKILEKGLLEVTCIDGIWSRNLQCFKTSCDGVPPDTPNGIPDITSRVHGHTIWYHCRRKGMTKVPGNVTCHFGSWIGIPPKCLDNPCYMRDLNFPGLVKPLTEYLDSLQNFDIVCEYGFQRANSLRKVTCNRGIWDITKNPCIRDLDLPEVDRLVSPTQRGRTPPPREVPHSVYVTPSNHQIPDIERHRECFCTYDYENDFAIAEIGGQPLKRGDSIKQGETVSIGCLDPKWILRWQNGFRFFGKINITCNICQKWQSADLPECSTTHSSDVIIGSPENFRVLLGGIVHVLRSQNSRFFCSSVSSQPLWHYDRRGNVIEHPGHQVVAGKVIYLTYMDIVGADDEHSGRYECYTQNVYGQRTGAAILELRVDDVYCPFFIPSNGLSVTYTNDNKYSSWAAFSCPASARLVGNSHSFCERNGTWSYSQPHCEFIDYVSCPRFPHSPDLVIKYSNHLSVGSIATFSCSSPARNLIGVEFAVCQGDGKWSNPPPSCGDPECSIGELASSVPETVELDMTGVNGGFVPSGSEMRLKCSDKSILQGNSKVLCGEDGKWKLRSKYECVPGCVLNIDPSSHLLIQPVQDSYRFGEFVLLSCPPGEEMSTNVERLMCLGGDWTDSLPVCKESKKSHQP